MKSRVRSLLGAGLLLYGIAVSRAQTTPDVPSGTPAAQPDGAASPPPSPFTRWGTSFSFLFDAYTDKNFNDPASNVNQLRNFDVLANSAQLSMAMMSIDRGPDPIGFHLDVGFGKAFEIYHSFDRAPNQLQHVEQAYVSFKPKSWHGLEVDAGEFVTAAGAEVFQSNLNWNYSRSLLFAEAIPYYHFGVRTLFPVGKHFTAGVQVVNGWNNIENTRGTGKTVGLNGAYAWKKVTWTNVYYGGLERDSAGQGRRQLFDSTVQVNATDKLSYYVNVDYGRAKNAGPGSQQWTGVAGAVRQALGKKFAIAARAEWFDDVSGYMTGQPQAVKEVTLTGEYKVSGWLLGRMEFRDDRANRAFSQNDNTWVKNQATVLAALVAYFGPAK